MGSIPALSAMNGEPTITADEFERQYAERCGYSVEKLRSLGRVVRRCYCDDYEACEGWKSVSQETAAGIDDPEKPWDR